MKKALLIGLAAVAVVGLVGALLVYQFVFSGNTTDYEGERSVFVPREADFDAVLDSLERAEIVANRGSLARLGRLTGWAEQVKPGHYLIPSGASNHDILDKIRKGLQSPVRLTIPPESTPDRVAAVAGRYMDFSAEEFLAALRDAELAEALGTDPNHLFGFMLPETYEFYWQTEADEVIRRIKQAFDDYYARELQAGAEAEDLTKEELVNLAAIVDWETYVAEEMPVVAGLYLNRLRTRGWRLQADPTVQYGLIEREGRKRRLLTVDYQLDHPYNTYRIDGLPPGPVTNPSKAALKGTAYPEDHRYFFMVARGDETGTHIFSRNAAEHRRATQAYYRTRDARRRAAREAEAGS